ncbi:MAG: hypothetical protein GY851_36760 [bacterium]|nr:hypothetical protein [bacterium]
MRAIRSRRDLRAAVLLVLPAACALLAAGNSEAALGGAMTASLWPHDADTYGPVTYHSKAKRLGFNKPGGMAWWSVRDIPEGTYHVVLTYSAVHGGSRPAGMVSVNIGDRSHLAELPRSGGRGLKRVLLARDVRIMPSGRPLKIRLDQGVPNVPTVFDLWRVDLVDPREALPGAGEAVAKKTPHGWYVQYIPYTAREPIRVLVSAHGTPGKGADLIKAFTENPSRVAQHFMSVAHDQGLILVLPVFDTPNFGGYEGPMGGYRGLFGRHIRADAFVNEILDGYKETFPGYDG